MIVSLEYYSVKSIVEVSIITTHCIDIVDRGVGRGGGHWGHVPPPQLLK